MHKKLGIQNANRFNYLSKSECYNVDGINDANDFQEIKSAMETINLTENDRLNIFKVIAGILHLGNIKFASDGHYAQCEHDKCIFNFNVNSFKSA